MTDLITKDGKLNIKTDKKGNLILFRNERCDDFYKKIKNRNCETHRKEHGIHEQERDFTNEINKYLPQRTNSRYYWGMTKRQNIEKLHKEAESNCECLVIAKLPKEKVSVGNYEVTNDLLDPKISEKDKRRIAKDYYDLISYTELEKLKPKFRKVRYGGNHLEFLVKK